MTFCVWKYNRTYRCHSAIVHWSTKVPKILGIVVEPLNRFLSTVPCPVFLTLKDSWYLLQYVGLTVSYMTYIYDCRLTLWSLVVTLCTTSFNSDKLRCAERMHLCFSYGYENKQRLFPYTAVTDWCYFRDGMCLMPGTRWIFKYSSG